MLKDKTIVEFIEELSGSAPVPGGGGVSALTGALGTALGNMVAALTEGKKKYADVEDEIKALSGEAQEIREKLVGCIDRDAECFAPLAKAYGLPSETEEQRKVKEEIMEDALRKACSVPVEIMELSGRAIELHREFALKGSILAVSDAGVGAILCKSALLGASLNIYINTKLMKDRDYAEKLNSGTDSMIKKYSAEADKIFKTVTAGLKK